MEGPGFEPLATEYKQRAVTIQLTGQLQFYHLLKGLEVVVEFLKTFSKGLF